MKASKLREYDLTELGIKLEDTRDELFKLRIKGATGHLENPSRIRTLRREIARCVTIIKEKSEDSAS